MQRWFRARLQAQAFQQQLHGLPMNGGDYFQGEDAVTEHHTQTGGVRKGVALAVEGRGRPRYGCYAGPSAARGVRECRGPGASRGRAVD